MRGTALCSHTRQRRCAYGFPLPLPFSFPCPPFPFSFPCVRPSPVSARPSSASSSSDIAVGSSVDDGTATPAGGTIATDVGAADRSCGGFLGFFAFLCFLCFPSFSSSTFASTTATRLRTTDCAVVAGVAAGGAEACRRLRRRRGRNRGGRRRGNRARRHRPRRRGCGSRGRRRDRCGRPLRVRDHGAASRSRLDGPVGRYRRAGARRATHLCWRGRDDADDRHVLRCGLGDHRYAGLGHRFCDDQLREGHSGGRTHHRERYRERAQKHQSHGTPPPCRKHPQGTYRQYVGELKGEHAGELQDQAGRHVPGPVGRAARRCLLGFQRRRRAERHERRRRSARGRPQRRAGCLRGRAPERRGRGDSVSGKTGSFSWRWRTAIERRSRSCCPTRRPCGSRHRTASPSGGSRSPPPRRRSPSSARATDPRWSSPPCR